MPSIEEHQSSETTKILFLGDSGSGKTGALASLAHAGYNLRILDTDNGVDIVKNVLLDKRSPYSSEARKRVQYVTITDEMKNINGRLIPKKATVWDRSIELLAHWREEGPRDEAGAKTYINDLGPVTNWTAQDFLCIDSLTFLAKGALNKVLSMNARLGGKAQQSDWFDAQNMVEGLLEMLYDDGLTCNVILCAHISYTGDENILQKGLPLSLGKALSPKIGRYFNNTIMAKTTGAGTAEKHKIITVSTQQVELKSSAPLRVKKEYDIEMGLAEYVKDLRGNGG